MIVPAIDQRYVHQVRSQILGRAKATKAATDNHYFPRLAHRSPPSGCVISSGRTGESSRSSFIKPSSIAASRKIKMLSDAVFIGFDPEWRNDQKGTRGVRQESCPGLTKGMTHDFGGEDGGDF